MGHPSVAELLAPVDDRPPAVTAHLSTCASCRRLTERAHPAAEAEQAATAPADLAELPIVDPTLYARVADQPEQRGGMGRTFVARDRRLGREVAIKQPLRSADVADPVLRDTLRQRFEREARLTARLEHPAIVAVHEAGRFPDGEAFYAMRRVSGTSLAAEIARRPELGRRLELLANVTIVAEALAYAHSRGVTHRDVTPANILIGAFGETVLIDWGLAADAASGHAGSLGDPAYRAGELPLTDFGVGTPGYMAPEQARGVAPAAAADVYALGATLYHLLAGRPPAEGTPRPLAALVPEVPPPLVALVTRAMAESPTDRFAAIAELAAELRRFQAGQLMIGHRYSAGELLRHYLRRYRVPVAIAAIAALVLVAATAVYVRGLARSRARTEAALRAAEASDHTTQAALRHQLGVTASQLAGQPASRLQALVDGVRAVAPDVATGSVEPGAWQGLVDALAAGPVATPLVGHHGAVNAATFARGGAEVLTADPDHVVRRWAVPSGRARGQLPLRLDRPTKLAVAPDGARLLVCGFDPLAEVLPLAGGPGLAVPLPLGDARCGFAPDGGAVIAAGREVRVLDPAGRVRARADLPAIVSAMAIGPDGLIALGTSEGQLVIWRPGAPPTVSAGHHTGGIYTVIFAGGGARLLSGGADGQVLSWPVGADGVTAPAVLLTRPGQIIGALVDLPDHRRVAARVNVDLSSPHRPTTVILGGAVPVTIDGFGPIAHEGALAADVVTAIGPEGGRLLDAATGRALLRLPPTAERTHGAVHLGDSLLLFSIDGAVLLWDLRSAVASGQLLGHTGEITALTVVGERLWSAALDGTVRGWALDDGAAPVALDLGSELVAAVLAPAGDRLALLGADGAVRLQRLAGDEPARTLAVPGAALAFAGFSADGAELVTGTTGGRAQRWDAATGAARGVIDLGRPVDLSAAAFAPDGRTIAFGATDGSLTLVDAATGAVRATRTPTTTAAVTQSGDAVDSLRFDGDGAALLVGFASARGQIVDGHTLEVRTELEGRPQAWLTDRRVLALAADGRVLVCSPRGGAPVVLDGTGRPVTAAALTPDQRWLAIADRTGKVQVWDLARGAALLSSTPAALDVPTALAFVADGRALAIGGSGGALRVVPLAPALAVARGCALLAYLGRDDDVAGLCPSGATSTPANQIRSRAPRCPFHASATVPARAGAASRHRPTSRPSTVTAISVAVCTARTVWTSRTR